MATESNNYKYADRIVRGSALVFVSTLVALFFAYLLRLFVTRTFTVEEYGLLYAVVVFMNFFAMFRDLGLNQALTKFIPEWITKNQLGKIRSSVLWTLKVQAVIAFAAAIILFVATPWLADYYFHTRAAVPLVQILAITFFVATFSGCFLSVLQGLQHIKWYSVLYPLTNTFTFIFTVVLVLVGFGLVGASVAHLATAIVLSTITFSIAAKHFPNGAENITVEDKIVFVRFAVPVLLGFVGGMALGATDTVVLTYFRSLREVGIYQAALPTSQTLWAIPTAIVTVFFPIVSEIWARGDKPTLSKGISLLLRLSFTLVLPLALSMLAWPEFVLNLLFGTAYVAGASTLQILALAVLAYTLWQICVAALSGIGKPGATTKIVLTAAIFNLVSNIILARAFGIVGVALTTLVSFLLAFFASYIALNRAVKIKLDAVAMVKSVISGFAMLAVIFCVKGSIPLSPWFVAAISSIVGIGVYCALVLRLHVIGSDDLEVLLKLNIPMPKFVVGLVKRIGR